MGSKKTIQKIGKISDENRALATLTESGTTVSLEFRFSTNGEVIEVHSSSRFREIDGEFVPTPWLGKFWNYQEQNGMLVAMNGEVEWQLAEKICRIGKVK